MIFAIDPGKDKSGIAVVDRKLHVYTKQIIPSSEIGKYITSLVDKFEIDRIVLGNGTTSEDMKKRLIELELGIPIQMIEEASTTVEAEKRYLNENPPVGLKKLFSFISWKPSRPVDDYVAVILAERYIKGDE